VRLVLPIILVLLLSGCSAAESHIGQAKETSAPAASEPKKSVRGKLVKKIGDAVEYRSNKVNEAVVIRFVVTDIQVDPICSGEIARSPTNGHFVAFDISVETFPGMIEVPGYEFSIAANNWKVIDSSGKTVSGTSDTNEASRCFQGSDYLPWRMGPAEKAVGKVVFDVPTPSGVLVFEGFEWAYPA